MPTLPGMTTPKSKKTGADPKALGPLDPEHHPHATYALDQTMVRGLTARLAASSGATTTLYSPATGQPSFHNSGRMSSTLAPPRSRSAS